MSSSFSSGVAMIFTTADSAYMYVNEDAILQKKYTVCNQLGR